MFRMTGDITVLGFKPFKFTSAKWKRHIDNYCDSASFKIPAVCSLKCTDGTTYTNLPTGLQFTEGMYIQIACGYDNNNPLRFKGFISRINYTMPLEIECEGYSYQLRTMVNFTKTYGATTVKQILTDLVAGTDIKLSTSIPDIPLPKAVFKNCTGTQVLDWFKEKCLLTVYFTFDTLYVGLREISVNSQVQVTGNVQHRLNWNVIKDNDLKFNVKSQFADVRIQLACRKKDGTKTKAVVGNATGDIKQMRTIINDPTFMAQLADDKRKELVNKGYEGSITTFLLPLVEPGMSDQIIDKTYPLRNGKYFCEGVDGELSKSGGRQHSHLGNAL